jgi:hypothetical protein
MTSRDEFSEPTKQVIGAQAGWLCAHPECGAATIGGKQGEPDGILNLGEAAHITAAAPGGKRYDHSLTPEQRRHHTNGIWLCRVCARLVDTDDQIYPASLLHDWKKVARERSWRQAANHISLFGPGLAAQAVEQIEARLMIGAAADIAAFKSTRRWPQHSVTLSLRRTSGSDSAPFTAAGLAFALASFNEIAIVARPGTGKSTTLIQTADALLAQATMVPALIPLAEWSRQPGTLRNSILTKLGFRRVGATEAELDWLAENGRLALLLDGWNELDSRSQDRLRAELEQLRRDFPRLAVLLSTRRQALEVPLEDPILLEVDALSDVQQLDLARGLRGTEGERLLDIAWRTSGVREVASNPLYLTALLTQTDGTIFPRTKEEVVRLFVDQHERSPQNAAALRSSLFDRQDIFLCELAVQATATANTALVEATARMAVTTAGHRLHADGQLARPIEPMDVLDTLVSHHALVRDPAGGGLSFQHQQIQEWYTSFEVERLMVEAHHGDVDASLRLRTVILDDPAWEEAILFAVDRLSRAEAAAAVGGAILAAVEIDPMLAAEMIRRADAAIWSQVADAIIAFGAAWHRQGEVDRAIGFMIRTGRPEFASTIWPLISHTDMQVSLGALRSAPRFEIGVLGAQVEARLKEFPDEIRSIILAEIGRTTGYDGLELVTQLAAREVSDEVRFQVIEALAFRRADRFVAFLLDSASDALWERIARKGFPDRSLYPEIDERLRCDRASLEAAETDPLKRLRQLVVFGQHPPDIGLKVRALIASSEFPITDSNAHHILREAFDRVPDAVSSAFVERLMDGRTLPRGAGEYLRQAQEQIDSGWHADAVLQPATAKEISLPIAAIIGPEVIGRLMDEAVTLHAKWRAASNRLSNEDRDRSIVVDDLIAQTRLGAFVKALLKRSPETAPDAIGKLADLFTRHGSKDEGRAQPLSSNVTTDVANLVMGWGEVLLSRHPFSRSAASQVAWLVGRLANPVFLSMLERLLSADLAGRQVALAIAEARRPGYEAALNDARTLHSTAYQQAFVMIGGEVAVKILSKYLDSSEFGFAAAVAIKQIWDHDNGPADRTFARWPDYSVVRMKRAERDRDEVPQEDSPFASVIFGAVERLKDCDDPKRRDLAVAIARIGFGLPHKDHPELVAQLLALPGNQSAKQLLLAAIALDGMVVSAAMILNGIRMFVEEAKSKTWMFRDSKWELDGWLELFAFSDRPMAVIDALELLPLNHGAAHEFERMLKAFGQSPSTEAERVLRELANRDPQFRDAFDWLAAFESRGSVDAVHDILDFVGSGAIKLSGHRHDIWGLGRRIAGAMEANPAIRDDLIQMYGTMPPGSARNIVEVAFADAPNDAAIQLMIEVLGREGRTIRQTPLPRALEKVMTEQRLSSDWRGAYEMILVPSHGLRKAIFGLADGDSAVAALAFESLVAMDNLRDRYGWADAKPRHPDIHSGRPWPLRLPFQGLPCSGP